VRGTRGRETSRFETCPPFFLSMMSVAEWRWLPHEIRSPCAMSFFLPCASRLSFIYFPASFLSPFLPFSVSPLHRFTFSFPPLCLKERYAIAGSVSPAIASSEVCRITYNLISSIGFSSRLLARGYAAPFQIWKCEVPQILL